MSYSINGKAYKLDTAEHIQPYIDELNAVEHLTKVDFSGNTIGIEASKALGAALATKSELEEADFSDIFTGRMKEEIPESLDHLLTGLLHCKRLHTVNLSDNAFGISTIEPLEKFLAAHVPLEHLLLANNGFGPAAGTRIANALAELAPLKQRDAAQKPLLTVVCGRNRLEAGSMEAWAKFLTAHGTIEELRLYQNGIRQEGIETLFVKGLANSPALRKLDLQDNTFTVRGARALVQTLHVWPHITEIQISDCLLSAEGGRLLGQRLAELHLPKLEILKLQFNEIDEAGLSLLVPAIKKAVPNLQLLELNGNCFPEDHELVDEINALFEERGFGVLDELDEMEFDSEEEDESSDGEAEKEEDDDVKQLEDELAKLSA